MNSRIAGIQPPPNTESSLSHTTSWKDGRCWKVLKDAGIWYLKDLKENSFSHLMLTVTTICAIWGSKRGIDDGFGAVLLYISAITFGEFYIERCS